jgi:hypothetical protein
MAVHIPGIIIEITSSRSGRDFQKPSIQIPSPNKFLFSESVEGDLDRVVASWPRIQKELQLQYGFLLTESAWDRQSGRASQIKNENK